MQESADNVGPDSDSSKDALLEEACKKYEEAIRLCPTLYDVSDSVLNHCRTSTEIILTCLENCSSLVLCS